MILKCLKYFFLLFQIFIFGKQISYSKIDLVLPLNNVSFSIENTQNFTSLAKDELHISSVFHSVDSKIKDNIPAEDLRKYIDGDYVEHQLAKKLADAGDDLLSSSGKFIDDVLEADYAKYLKRKAKQGKTPRERLEWKKVRDYWLNDSPLARGNNFNKKAWKEEWYPAWEVRLDNGKFIDGYNPFTKEIVSRKATELVDIQESTFIKYLDELKTKYSPPRTITTKKQGEVYDLIRGKPLPKDAKLILEIPDSNKSFTKINEYIEIAKNKGIEIRFRPE